MPQALVDDDLWSADRTAAAETPAAQPTIRRAEADPRPGGADRHSVRAAQRDAVEHAAARDGLRLGHDLLAAAGALAAGRRLEAAARACCWPNCAAAASSIWRAPSSTAPRSARCAGEKNWTEPYRSPQSRVEASCSHRRARDSARRDADRGESARHHPVAPAGRRHAAAARAVRPARAQAARWSKATAATIRSRIATQLHRRGIASATRQAAAPPTAAASAAPAGSSSAPWPGCIAFADWPCATNVAPVSTKRFSRSRARSSVGTILKPVI